MSADATLAASLGGIVGHVELLRVPVTRQGHSFDYALYVAWVTDRPGQDN